MNKSQNSTHNHTKKQYYFYVVDVPHNAKSHFFCFTAVKREGVTGLLKHIL